MYRNIRYAIGSWKIDVSGDIEVYRRYKDSEPELIPHSNYGDRFLHESTAQERAELISKVGNDPN